MRQGHYYDPKTGEARHFVPKADGKGNRPTTIRDAKAHGWYPGVTSILQVLDKPALRAWMVKQAVMAVVTAPDVPGEDLDAKITRVLDVEEQQDEEAVMAADRGKLIHTAVEDALNLRKFDPAYKLEVEAVIRELSIVGKVVDTEKIVIGEGYGGRTDVIQENDLSIIVTDIKTSKTMPEKGSWLEHRLQTAAYAKAIATNTGAKRIVTCNVYVSTAEPGKAVTYFQNDWEEAYERGFKPLLDYWTYMKGYQPPKRS